MNSIRENIKRILKEENQPKYLKAIKGLIEPFKEEDCVCDINVSYDDEDDMYSIYICFGTEELNDEYFSLFSRANYVKLLKLNIDRTIRDFIPIKNFYVGSYATPYCGWKSGD